MLSRLPLDALDLLHSLVQGRCHQAVHRLRFMPLDEDGCPAAAAQELLQFLVRDACQHGGVGDLVAIEVQDRQHRAVGGGVEELVRVPGGGQRPGLGLAVADHAGDDQVGVVEHGAEGMAERVAQLAAFVDRTRALGRGVARDAAGKRELPKQLLQAGFVAADLGVDLAVAAFQVGVAHHRRAAMAGARDIDHVQIAGLDDAVEVRIDEVLARCRAPMPQQHGFDVGQAQRALEQRVVPQEDLADGQIVRGTPVGVQVAQAGLGR